MSWWQSEDEHDEEKRKMTSRRKSIFVITNGNYNIQMLHLISALVQLVAALNLVQAVQVQRLNVPDLVVIDSHITASAAANQQQQQQRPAHNIADLRLQTNPGQPPEAASLIQTPPATQQQQQQITFECLVSYDEKKDRNLVVKWHHDERMEPIYQWIPELNKRSIAPQYRAYIVPIIATTTTTGDNHSSWSTNQTLSAGFRLVRPTKELAGKYTCSAISSQNDDSKSKKMIVYTPPRSFSFNATRANLAALFASQRDRLLQLSHPQPQAQPQLPAAYRMRTYDNQAAAAAAAAATTTTTTLSPQMLSTIDYVNVNQQRARHQAATRQTFYWPNATAPSTLQQPPPKRPQFGLKLVCDIDQVFPVPEVSIYRLAKLDGSHPEKLAKLDTRIERDSHSGLFHVQVISVLDDEDLLGRYYQHRASNSTEQLPHEIYFECLIALTNLELSRYAENRRTIIYRPGALASSSRQQGLQTNENMDLEQVGSGAQALQPCALIGPFLLTVTLLMLHKWQSHR